MNPVVRRSSPLLEQPEAKHRRCGRGIAWRARIEHTSRISALLGAMAHTGTVEQEGVVKRTEDEMIIMLSANEC